MAKKDLRLNPPTKKSELTKDNMLFFVKTYGTADEKKWFYELLKNNRLKKKNNLTGEITEGYDIQAIRKAFIAKFPEFGGLEKKKKQKQQKQGRKKACFHGGVVENEQYH